jgi:hypothetical protein
VVGAIGRTVGRHSSQRSSSSPIVRDREPLCRPAPISSNKPGLDLLGLAHRGLGLTWDLLAHVALAASKRVTAGVDLDLEAGSSLADHGPSAFPRHAVQHQTNDEGMTTEQAKQSAQAVDLGVWVGLAGLEPATERL